MSYSSNVKYSLDKKGYFLIENYSQCKPFSNFFPGIAGLWGIPMWAFYVNRGQCITSFGIESKDKSIMEFQPANKAYRLTSLQGFRTFIKVRSKNKTVYWEPFQENLRGTDFKKKQKMSISAHDLTISESNDDLGLTVNVNYFTLPEEPYAALIRHLTIENHSSKSYEIEVIDGLPMIVPFGLKDWLAKNLSRTVEAWVKVRNVEEKAPFYQLNVEVSDTPEVKHIKEGNFFFSFSQNSDGQNALISPIVETSVVFGAACNFSAPQKFLQENFCIPKIQQTSNRTPSALSYHKTTLKQKKSEEIISFFGYAHNIKQVNKVVDIVIHDGFVAKKAKRNKEIIDEIRNFAFTQSSSVEFNLYAEHTFLDNVLRGGLPVSLKTSDGNIALNVYSRKHGDIERDYNFFLVSPTYYSQGNGNYRDVNQNRRNDVWFNSDVKDANLMDFLNLSQADGYNPLIVKGTAFSVSNMKEIGSLLEDQIEPKNISIVKKFLENSFMPGELLTFISHNNIKVKNDPKEFLGKILEVCQKQECADHGEGFWSDHWTYNLDAIESYLALYPDKLKELLLDQEKFYFYHNNHYVLPREQRYVLTQRGVRQYGSVKDGTKEIDTNQTENKLRIKHGEGDIYYTHLIGKLLCIVANKVASLDPSGIGIEMEADKPNWYDALNGLPGLIGSSVSETFELKRCCQFLLDSVNQIIEKENKKIKIFQELATFITGLTNILSGEIDETSYWNKSNDIKESYRHSIRNGIVGFETDLTFGEIKQFLNLIIKKTEKAEKAAKKDREGFLSTYFYHEVVKYEKLGKSGKDQHPFIKPLRFKRHALPLFLEGFVHELKSERDIEKRRAIYQRVRMSDLYDKKIKMYKVNTDLSEETEEIGRTRIFPSGWLENESIWLHMEYKFMLELLRGELYEEFYKDFKKVLIPFLNPETYGRSILENSSFLVSSAHEDKNLHGQGFVARLSGSTAEFLHIWLFMNVGKNPFRFSPEKELILTFEPSLPGWLFTKKKSKAAFFDAQGKKQTAELPPNIYAFNFLGSTLVVYHNPQRKDTFGDKRAKVSKIELWYFNLKNPLVIDSSIIPEEKAKDIRQKKVFRIDVYLK